MKPNHHVESIEEITKWLNWADRDYLAARLLLLDGHLISGTIMAHYCLEKYLKTSLLFFGQKTQKGNRGHNISELYKNLIVSGGPEINKDFLNLVNVFYSMRYPDSLEAGYNIGLGQAKIISELDSTVFKLRQCFNIKKGKQNVKFVLEQAMKEGHKSAVSYNCAFIKKIKRKSLFKNLRRFYDNYVDEKLGLVEAFYEVKEAKDDMLFEIKGLIRS